MDMIVFKPQICRFFCLYMILCISSSPSSFFPPLLFCFVCLERGEWNRGLNGVKSGFMRGRKKREKEFTSYSLNISTFCTFSDFSKFKFRAKRMNFILRPIEKGRRIFKDFRTKYSCHKVFYTSNLSLFS